MVWLKIPRYFGLTPFNNLQATVVFCKVYLKYTRSDHE